MKHHWRARVFHIVYLDPLPPIIMFQFVFHVFTHFLNKLLKKLKIQDEKVVKISNRMKTNLNLIDIYLEGALYIP